MVRWFPRLLLVNFLFQAAVTAVRPMVSYRAIELGAGPLLIGVVASAYAALALVTGVSIGRWVDRWGEARFVALGVGLVAVASVWLLWIESVWVLVLNQSIMGLGHILMLLACQTLIANASAPGRRDAAFGAFVVVVSLGQLVGPALAGVLAGRAAGSGGAASPGGDGDVVFLGAAAVTLVTLLLAATLHWRPDGSGAESSKTSDTPVLRTLPAVRHVLRQPGMPPAMLASLTVLTSVDLLAAYLPLYGEATGLSVQVVGLLLSVRAGASMASRLLMLPLVRAVGRRRLLIWSMALPALLLLAFPILHPVPALLLAMVLIGFGLGLGQPLTLTWVSGQVAPEVRGTAIGVRLTANRVGQLLLPAGVGALAGATGLAVIFPALGLMLLASSLLVITAPPGGEAREEPLPRGEPT